MLNLNIINCRIYLRVVTERCKMVELFWMLFIAWAVVFFVMLIGSLSAVSGRERQGRQIIKK